MESPTNIIKRAPKWAWYAAGGIGLGVIGLRVWRGRAGASTSTPSQATDASSTVPGSQASSPTPVIVPPVIQQSTGGDGGDAAGILTAVSGIFAPVIDDFTGLLSTTVQANSANLDTFVSGVEGNNSQWLAALASGGLAPQPASVQPTIIVQPNAPAPVTAGIGTSAPVASCPAAYPHWNPANGGPSARSCYKDCGHDECHGGKQSRESAHCYQNGDRQTVSWTVIGGKC